MSNISLVEAKLPPGFRFHPKDEELVCDYLMKKLTHNQSLLLIDVDLNKCEPWDIPETACVGGKEWYFYTQRDRKYATGQRTNRATASGYWKATGKDRTILRKGTLVGMRKTLVFYQGRAPKGRKTEWVMHEFRIEGPLGPPKTSSKEDWVLCRVFYKNREVGGKQSMGSSSCYDDTGSSSLPPLMDSYISFDQQQQQQQQPHHHHHPHPHAPEYDDYDEQVPCFSIFSHHHHQNQTCSPQSIFNHISTTTTTMDPIINSTNDNDNASIYGGILAPNLGSCLDPYSCDRKVLKAVLSQLTEMERNPPNNTTTTNNNSLKGSSPSLGEGSSESYLSEVAMPNNMWNSY